MKRKPFRKRTDSRGIFFFLMLLLCFPLSGIGQGTQKLSGVVVDKTGLGLPGVTILLKGTGTGTATDIDGKFTLTVPVKGTDPVLVFSSVGYKNIELAVKDLSKINVTMEEEASELEEVVVVGYGTQKKESSVAAIAQIDGDNLVKSSASSLTNALTGQVPGISTVQASGEPGADKAKIFIRGVSSWQGNSPLVLVDGIERNFNDIDPNEVKTLSVLKDASATAVFGIRGANGVILVTTKRGAKGAVKVNASAEWTMKQPIGMITPENSYITGLVMNEANKNDNNWGALLSDEVLNHYRDQDMPYVYPNTNWQEHTLKKAAFSQKYNVNISGGTDFARVFASISYTYEGDVLKTEKQADYNPKFEYNRYNYRVNVDMDVTPSTVLSLDAGGYIGIKNSPFESNNQRIYRPISMLGPMEIPVYYPEEFLLEHPDRARPDEFGDRIASTGVANAENPLIALNHSGFKEKKVTELNATVKVEQKLDFFTKGLSVNAKVAYDNNTGYMKNFPFNAVAYRLNPDYSWARYVGRDGKLDGELPETPITANAEEINGDPMRTWYLEAALNYTRQFGDHEVGALALGQRRKKQSNVGFPRYEQGLVGRVTYNYAQRYLAEVNIGYNGSEQFAPSNRYGLFPSYALGWNVHNETFFKPILPVVSRLKLRFSYGEVGSDAAESRWLYTSSYVNGNQGNKYKPGTAGSSGPTNTTIVEEKMANINATWERAVKQDFGAEISFMKNNMFTLNLDFFKEKRDHILLGRKSVPDLVGIETKEQNLGKTETKGYELELKFQYQLRSGWNLWAKPSVSFSDNRIIERDEPKYKPNYQKEAGKRIFQQFGYHSTGMVQNADDQMNNVRYGTGIMGLGDAQWVDFNGDGKIDESDKTPIGYSTQYPLYNYSFSGGFSYRNFEMDFMFQAVSHVSRVVIDAFAWPLHRLANHVFDYQMDVWSPDNRDAQYNSYHFDANRSHNAIVDAEARTLNTYDASYLRLKTLNFAYSLPERITSRMKLSQFKIFVRGNNLFTWAPNYPLADPEGSDGGDGRVTNGNYPMLRRFSLGAQVTF